MYKERGTVIVQTELSALPRPPRPRLRGNDDDVRCANNIAFQRRPTFRRWEILFQKLEKRMLSLASSVASTSHLPSSHLAGVLRRNVA